MKIKRQKIEKVRLWFLLPERERANRWMEKNGFTIHWHGPTEIAKVPTTKYFEITGEKALQ